jgi:colanic acid/amylovoran biosynthesis glycosyltransferase
MTARYRPAFQQSVFRNVRPDILHGHFAFESWRAIAAGRAGHVPLVTTFYGLDVDKLPRRRVWQRRYEILFQRSAAIIAEGPFMAERIRRLGCPAEKINVVKIGISINTVTPSLAASDSAVNVVFVGLSREKKGPLDAGAAFCSAARMTPELKLHLVGDGPYHRRLVALFRRAGLLDRVVFHGMISHQAYLELVAKSQILLAPSVTARDGDSEGGAPVSVIEALAAGVPVVSTEHCDIPNIVAHGATGLLCKEHDVSALAENLARLAMNPTLRASMGTAGRIYAVAEHTIEIQARKIRSVYDSVRASPARSGTGGPR